MLKERAVTRPNLLFLRHEDAPKTYIAAVFTLVYETRLVFDT